MAVFANSVKLMLAAGLLLAGTAVVAYSADSGEELYTKLCSGCHSPSPAMKGKPVDALLAGMDRVKNMSNATGAAARMQQVLQPLTPEQTKSIATYINGLK
jgi:mono/diheme cytochrome c family protein